MPPRIKDLTFQFHTPIKVATSLEQKAVKRRVLNLYKAWYRQLPVILYDLNMVGTQEEYRSKLRGMFIKNSRMTDLRAIDQLVLKGQMELNECVNKQKEPCHIYKLFDKYSALERKPQDFLGKFLNKSDS